MHRALQAIEMRILRRQPRDQAQYAAQCGDSHGSRALLLGACEQAEVRQSVERLGVYLATVEHLQHLGQAALDDHLALPANLLAQHAIELQDLRSGASIPGLVAMADELLQQHAPGDTQHLRQDTQLHPVLCLAAQARRVEQKLRRHGFASHQRRLELSPLGLLWSAWRMR